MEVISLVCIKDRRTAFVSGASDQRVPLLPTAPPLTLTVYPQCLSWDDAAGGQLFHGLGCNTIDHMEQYAQSADAANDFIYLNYAGKYPGSLSYGEGNVQEIFRWSFIKISLWGMMIGRRCRSQEDQELAMRRAVERFGHIRSNRPSSRLLTCLDWLASW